MAGNNQYFGTVPSIAQAYQNDPRTKLAANALALGTSTAPVAGGGWAVPDGLARAAQAIVGALVTKNQDKRYAAREDRYLNGWTDEKGVFHPGLSQVAQMANAPQPGQAPNPAAVNPATVNPAQPPIMPVQLPPSSAPQQPGAPPMMAAAQALGGTQAVSPVPPPPMPPPQPEYTPIGPQPNPTQGGTGPSRGAPPALKAAEYYTRGIVPIEGGTNADGSFRTSPKGAIGPGQIMPGTAPEAARLAGLPYDRKRLRTDPEYNNALGQAYYAAQLETFGDPLKAAGAYNAGPGATRRAIRRANAAGDEQWWNYYPAANTETPAYVKNFADKIGGTWNGEGEQGDTALAGVAPPHMEQIPDAPPAPGPQPGAPQLPGEVQSNRLVMAQQLLSTGNPDLAAIAQTYLDKGLDEQNNARTLASQQQFGQSQTGYNASLQDWQGERSDARGDAYGQRRDAVQRNFQRETKYGDQTFQAGQSAADRRFRSTESSQDRTWQNANREDTQAFQAEQAALDRANKTDVAGMRTQNRNAYLNTATGLKMQQENGLKVAQNANAISQLERFKDLNEGQRTGGVLGALGITNAYGPVNSAIAEMSSISSLTTLSALGGSLGTAISDGDRKFIAGANVNTNNGKRANDNIANAAIGAMRRQNDYLTEFGFAQADGNAAQFARDWSKFINSVPIVQYDKNGNAIATDKPMTFEEWRNSRPQFDASGKRVK